MLVIAHMIFSGNVDLLHIACIFYAGANYLLVRAYTKQSRIIHNTLTQEPADEQH